MFNLSLSDDHSRVCLSAASNVSGSDYINASTIVSNLRIVEIVRNENSVDSTKSLRDHIKSFGKFAIFTRLRIEGGGGQRHITEKLPLKIQTVDDIDAKITKNDLEGNRDRQ